MLVLTRKLEESVVVGDPDGVEEMVKVTVLAIAGGKVRLGFDVAGDLPIHRWEVWQRIQGKRVNKSTTGVVLPVAAAVQKAFSGRS